MYIYWTLTAAALFIAREERAAALPPPSPAAMRPSSAENVGNAGGGEGPGRAG
jgi:hypothetical protein